MRHTKPIAAVMSQTTTITLYFADQTTHNVSPNDRVLRENGNHMIPVRCNTLSPNDVIAFEDDRPYLQPS